MFGAVRRVTFEEVSRRATKAGKCGCGKRRQRSRTFMQTLSPFNKNDKGDLKTRSEIYDELEIEVKEWKGKPITCDDCR